MLRVLTFSLVALFTLPSLASAQRVDERATLEIGFDHGFAQLREPGEETIVSGAAAAIDVRVHDARGWGAMLRVGTTFGRILTLELDLAPTFRAWLVRSGPRGLEIGGGLGVSMFWNAWARRLGVDASLLGGGVATIQVDYREHGFFVGVAYAARWLPFGAQGDLDLFTFTTMLRVGGEVSL